MSNIDWSEGLDLVSDWRTMVYRAGDGDEYVITRRTYPLGLEKPVSAQRRTGPRGSRQHVHLGYFSTIGGARRAINRALKEAGPCRAWLDIGMLLSAMPDDEPEWSGLPTISCALPEGHDGDHQASVDSEAEEEA